MNNWLDKYITVDNNGYWDPKNHGKPVKINSNQITMKGVNQPLVGISDTGHQILMQPEQDYSFNGSSVIEYPLLKRGGVTWLNEYQNGGQAKPIFTSDPNDPRLKAYNDSLSLYNKYNKPPEGLFENSNLVTVPYDRNHWHGNDSNDINDVVNQFTYYPDDKKISGKKINELLPEIKRDIFEKEDPINIKYYVNSDGSYTPRPEFRKPTYPVLKKEIELNKIKTKQQELVKAGLLQPNDVDGQWGPKSSNAWDKYIGFPEYDKGNEALKKLYNLDKPETDKSDSLYYLASLKLLQENGHPNLDLNANVPGRPKGAMSNYNHETNTIHLDNSINKDGQIVSEISHSKQYQIDKFGQKSHPILDKLSKEADNILKTKGEQAYREFYDKNFYETPGTNEYNAHKEIQPLLEKQHVDYYNELDKNNALNKYQPKVTTTPVDENNGNPKKQLGGWLSKYH